MADMINDGLVSFTSKMGTDRDKAATAQYVASSISPIELSNAYRTSWLARAVVDKKSDDATRKWREWNGTDDEVIAIEREERRLQIKAKVNKALKLASLHGGAAIYFDTGQNETEELRLDRVGKGGLRFATVMRMDQLSIDSYSDDPRDARFGQPLFYKIKTDGKSDVLVHWSRFAIFTGGQLLDTVDGNSWGDSDLLPVINSMKQFESTAQNVSSIVYEAKIDVFGIKGLTDLVRDPAGEDKLKRRYGLLAQMKGVNGMIVMDMDNETYDQKNASFTGLTDVLDRFQQIVSGATGYPQAILFGTSSGGLGSSGDLELSAYYDRISEKQENDIEPAIYLLDECLIRSALGNRPEEIFYSWRSLWQMSDKEKAEIGKMQSEIVQILRNTDLFDDDELRDAAVNMFNESGTMAGLDSIPRDDDELGAL